MGGRLSLTIFLPQKSLLLPYPWVSWLTGSGEKRLSRRASWGPYSNCVGSSLSVGRSFSVPAWDAVPTQSKKAGKLTPPRRAQAWEVSRNEAWL